ncbi:MAG TPA: GntR family transcriptional regulator [Candidatus Sabulitectum sp.]|nr:GntR family transcriptional regulator [Candidatus Sabulitectum sp.]HPF33753.1 GntR family transcriptional regulator [Candidatus Sabulitectum sp.]HPJ28586.1 GntR family transcriptional regulator [Candidatus Sabulitectum sp.]HPR22655.1 GntR family transcriptional regulator [Candidatus Sabulitectum sp.]
MIKIDSCSAVPVYEQLKRQIKLGISSGRYPAEHRLPSIRELARELTVNPNTIAKAYRQLETEGFLESRAGLGFFVIHFPSRLMETRKELLEELAEDFTAKAVELGATSDMIIDAVRKRLEGKPGK